MKTLFFITGMIGLCMAMSDGYLFPVLNFTGCFVMALSVSLHGLFDSKEEPLSLIGRDVYVKDWLKEMQKITANTFNTHEKHLDLRMKKN